MDTINTIPAFIAAQTACKQSDELILFYTKSHPFSNFHPAKFEVDGQEFNCVEQYLSYHKAMLFDEGELAQAVMTIDEPSIQKRKVRSAIIKKFNYEQWKQEAGKILKVALAAKFEQNQHLKEELINSGETILGEASATDKLFGIGLSLNNPKAVQQSEWPGENLQGVTLMAVRAEM